MILAAMMLAGAASCASIPTQPAMQACQKAAADRADAAMNVQWKRTRAAIEAAGRDKGIADYGAALMASQRTWLAFRDAQCRVESYEWHGGSMQSFTENQCLTQVTTTRTRQLRDLASGATGR